MTVRDAVTFHALDAAHMPADAEMTPRRHRAGARTWWRWRKRPRARTTAVRCCLKAWPVAQIFAEVLGQNLALRAAPGDGGGRGGAFAASELEGRMGARMLPDSFDVVDDPTQKEWRGRPLFGSYDVDREGVRAKPLRLVEKGVLKGFLLTRQPVRGFEGSNGRARLPGSVRRQRGRHQQPVRQLRGDRAGGRAEEEADRAGASTRNKPYGIMVRKMDFPSTASLDEVRRLFAAAAGRRARSACRSWSTRSIPDGREELVRGLRFRGLQCALAEGHSGGGRRQHGLRLHGQRRAVRADRRRRLHARRPAWWRPRS